MQTWDVLRAHRGSDHAGRGVRAAIGRVRVGEAPGLAPGPAAQGEAWAEGACTGRGARPGAGGGPTPASGGKGGPGSTNLEAGNLVKKSACVHRRVLLTCCKAAALSLLQKSQTPCVAPCTGNATAVRELPEKLRWLAWLRQEERALGPRGQPGRCSQARTSH